MDAPTYGEESKQKLCEGLGSEYIREAISNAGLSVSDFYFTTLVKSRKAKGSTLTNEQINACSKYLQREIEILQPGLIVGLGSMTLKHLIKGSRYTQADAGKVEFAKVLNAAVLVGINPQSVYRDPSKQALLNSVFVKTGELINV
jgi:DNA polymerase-3 subunit alpha